MCPVLDRRDQLLEVVHLAGVPVQRGAGCLVRLGAGPQPGGMVAGETSHRVGGQTRPRHGLGVADELGRPRPGCRRPARPSGVPEPGSPRCRRTSSYSFPAAPRAARVGTLPRPSAVETQACPRLWTSAADRFAGASLNSGIAAPALRSEVTPMTFDVHQLDLFVLVGAGVTLLAILAVRVSSRAGLPSLLLYLLMGVALGENGVGIELRERRARARARVRGAGADPGRGRSDHQLGRGAAVDAARRLAGDPRRRGVGRRSSRVGAHFLLGLSWELAVLLGAVTSPTDAAAVFSVLRGLPLLAPAGRRARGRVRAQRRPDRRPGHADLDRRRRRPRHARPPSGVIVFELVAGVAGRPGRRLRRRLADAPRRPAVVGPLPARGRSA